ncbi:unnamed protein product [Urochloa humidicola]
MLTGTSVQGEPARTYTRRQRHSSSPESAPPLRLPALEAAASIGSLEIDMSDTHHVFAKIPQERNSEWAQVELPSWNSYPSSYQYQVMLAALIFRTIDIDHILQLIDVVYMFKLIIYQPLSNKRVKTAIYKLVISAPQFIIVCNCL